MVKLTQDLARGFKPWKDMFLENEATLNALGAKLVFAGTEKDNDNKLTVIIDTKYVLRSCVLGLGVENSTRVIS